MTRQTVLRHTFVDTMPDELDEGVLYVSMPYATALHKCCCGCGNEVVTPLSPTDWSLTFNGEAVSLYPSIGNWSFACKSHYWIAYDHVWWMQPGSKADIKSGGPRDRLTREHNAADLRGGNAESRRRWWERLKQRLRRRTE